MAFYVAAEMFGSMERLEILQLYGVLIQLGIGPAFCCIPK